MTSTLRSECEVYGLFKDLIPVEALENEVELERGRGRQGLLPDFKMEIPSPAGEPIPVLPNGLIFSDFGPESDFFEQNGPELVRITPQKSGLGGNK